MRRLSLVTFCIFGALLAPRAAGSGVDDGALTSVSAPTVERLGPVFRAALKTDVSKRIFDFDKVLTTEPGIWLGPDRSALLVSMKVDDAQTCHADGYFNEFVGVVHPKTHALLGGVYHARGDGAEKRELWGNDRQHLLYVLHEGGQGYSCYEAVVLTFTEGGIRIRTSALTQESRDKRIETTADGAVLFVLRDREGTMPEVLKTLVWDSGKGVFVPVARQRLALVESQFRAAAACTLTCAGAIALGVAVIAVKMVRQGHKRKAES
jgi:hypothetical protein